MGTQHDHASVGIPRRRLLIAFTITSVVPPSRSNPDLTPKNM